MRGWERRWKPRVPRQSERTRAFRLNEPVGKEDSERAHPRSAYGTTIRAKCPASNQTSQLTVRNVLKL
jgi:hypothetical protein